VPLSIDAARYYREVEKTTEPNPDRNVIPFATISNSTYYVRLAHAVSQWAPEVKLEASGMILRNPISTIASRESSDRTIEIVLNPLFYKQNTKLDQVVSFAAISNSTHRIHYARMPYPFPD